MGMPTATVRMRGPDGISRISSGIGSGPVDAAYKVPRSSICCSLDPAPAPSVRPLSPPCSLPSIRQKKKEPPARVHAA